MMRIAVAIGSVWLLSACSTGSSETAPTADISRILKVKAAFGPEFKVTEAPKNGVDPKKLTMPKLPPGLRFDPSECSSFVIPEELPAGLQVNMAGLRAEGDGNRFIVEAVQTSQRLPFNEPPGNCKKVAFQGGRVHGLKEVVEVPHIDGTKTLGVRYVIQTVVQGKPLSGEQYSYTSQFGDYQVLVTANPLVKTGQPATPIDTARARDLLVKSVAAIKD
jgi:hypothetical protein